MLKWEQDHQGGRPSEGLLSVTWSEAGVSVSWTGSAIAKPDDMAGFVDLCLLVRASARRGW